MSASQPLIRRRRTALPHSTRVLAAFAVVALGLLALAGGPVPSAGAVPARTAPDPAATSKAWILVDVDSGEVLAAHNERQPMGVASTTKIITALVARRSVPIHDPVPISAHAEGMPALKISVKAGQHWDASDLLHSMLLASANDAAVALAERAGGGSLDGFQALVEAEARRLGLADHPVLQDPAGLDDEFSVRGGNSLSARDLAIATRAFLADPLLASIVRMPDYRFHGGDDVDHRVVGHNTFMRTYPGAIGVKTGYTDRSGSSLVAAARRGGHTYVAVVIDSTNADAQASTLLDGAFAGTARPPAHGDVLPPVPPGGGVYAGPGASPAAAAPTVGAALPPKKAASDGAGLAVALIVVMTGSLLVVRRRKVAAIEAARRSGRRPPRPGSSSGRRSPGPGGAASPTGGARQPAAR